jgi:hypothetical protein
MKLGGLLGRKKSSKILIKKEPKSDDTTVYDWLTGEEIGEIRKTITNKENIAIAYEIKYFGGNIVQHTADQIEVTEDGYILLTLWLKDAKVACGRLVDAQKRLDELRKMFQKNAISLETFTEMAKISFNMEFIRKSEKSIVEVDLELEKLLKEKNRLEQEIYSLDIKRRVGIKGRVEYAKASLELTEAYKRVLSHVEEVKDLRNSLVKTLTLIKEKEEIPEEELDKMKARKYEIHVTL